MTASQGDRLLISLLWVFVAFNIAFADILSLYMPGVLPQVMQGRVRVLGKHLDAMKQKALREMRARHIGMVFQDVALMPHRSVRENVGYPLESRKIPKSKRWAISDHCLGRVDLTG